MLAVVADLLDQGQVVNRLSIPVTAIAVGVLLLPVFPASYIVVPTAVVVVLVGLLEFFLALRVGVNAALLRRLAEDAAQDRLDLAALDSALLALRLIPTKSAGQPIAGRFTGTRRLLQLQQAALVIQVGAAVVGGLMLYWQLA